MKTKNWSQLTLITILLSPVICVYVRDLDPIGAKTTIKTRIVGDKLFDDIDDQFDSDLIPPNFQPDPLLPLSIGDEDNFEDVGHLNKERIGDDRDDPVNRYIGNVFDSLPEASNIFDALRLNSPDSDLSEIPPELLIPLLMDRRLSVNDEGHESRDGEFKEATLKMAKFIVDSKHVANKSDKLTGKDHERKLVGKLSPLKSSSTTLTSQGSIKTTTDKPNQSEEEVEVIIDEKIDQVHGNEEDEEKSKKSTTKSSKFRYFDNPLIRWFTKTKTTTPKGDHRAQGKTTTNVSEVTTEGPKSPEAGDEDDDLTSSNSTSTVKPSTKSSNSSSPTTTTPSSINATTRGKGKSSIPPTTGHSTKSDSEELSKTSKGKHSKATSTSKPSKKEEDTDKTKDPIDTFLSSLNVDPSGEIVNATKSSTNSSTAKSDAKHSHKHEKTTPIPTSTTPIDVDRATTIGPDSESTEKSTIKESETKATTESSTLQPKDDDVFPTVSVTKPKTKSHASTTPIPRSLTTQNHKTIHHSSTTTMIPNLRPYSEDPEELLLPDWNPDVFP